MGYAKASSQQFKLIDELPELSELEVNESHIPDAQKYDKFLIDKHKTPPESGMTAMHSDSNMTNLDYTDQKLIYSSGNNIDKVVPIMENETKIIVEEDVDVVDVQNSLEETKNYKEPPPNNHNWSVNPQMTHQYYNNPYNNQPPFPIMSNYNPYVQVPSQPYNNYNNITNGYSVPVVNHYPNNNGQFSVPIENFDTVTNVEVPDSIENRNGKISPRKLNKKFKKFNSKVSDSESNKSPWSSQWNNCVGVSDHIKSCPVCSKLYNNNNNQIIYIIIIVILLIVCLILLQKVLTG